jgi:hypothetical protein
MSFLGRLCGLVLVFFLYNLSRGGEGPLYLDGFDPSSNTVYFKFLSTPWGCPYGCHYLLSSPSPSIVSTNNIFSNPSLKFDYLLHLKVKLGPLKSSSGGSDLKEGLGAQVGIKYHISLAQIQAKKEIKVANNLQSCRTLGAGKAQVKGAQ